MCFGIGSKTTKAAVQPPKPKKALGSKRRGSFPTISTPKPASKTVSSGIAKMVVKTPTPRITPVPKSEPTPPPRITPVPKSEPTPPPKAIKPGVTGVMKPTPKAIKPGVTGVMKPTPKAIKPGVTGVMKPVAKPTPKPVPKPTPKAIKPGVTGVMKPAPKPKAETPTPKKKTRRYVKKGGMIGGRSNTNSLRISSPSSGNLRY